MNTPALTLPPLGPWVFKHRWWRFTATAFLVVASLLILGGELMTVYGSWDRPLSASLVVNATDEAPVVSDPLPDNGEAAAAARARRHAKEHRLSVKLGKILTDFDNAHPGIYGLKVFTLDHHITASHRSGRAFVTASTYKMFLAYTVYHRAERGLLKLSTPLMGNYTIGGCITPMIVVSDNACAIALEGYVGPSKEQAFLESVGFSHTNINNYNAYGQLFRNKHSNANDEGKFLDRLARGKLMNKAHTKHLLGLMSVQVFRDGLPAGVPKGVRVADKVGFLNNWQNDVGIVYGKKRTYVIVGLSDGGSRPTMSILSRQVYKLLNS